MEKPSNFIVQMTGPACPTHCRSERSSGDLQRWKSGAMPDESFLAQTLGAQALPREPRLAALFAQFARSFGRT
jgi:hypothetical protein